MTRYLIAIALIVTCVPGAFAAPKATPSGTTLMDGDSVSTAANAAVIHLANRRAVRIEPYSTARFQSSGNAVLVSVAQGRASFASANGVHALAANESALIEPDGSDEDKVDLCELTNWEEELELCSEDPKNDKCDWRFLEAKESEVEALLARGARYQGEDGLDCDDDIGALLLGAGAVAALTGAQIAGIVAGGVLGAVVVDEIDDSGSNQPVTDLSGIQ